MSSPLKKRPSSSAGGHTSQGSQNNDSTSSSIATAMSIKCELYDAPRRSLRQKGLIPEQTGFPYYSPPRPRKTPHDKSNTSDSATDKSETNPEAVNEGAATKGEQMDHETSKDDVAIMEDEGQPQRRTSGRRSGRGRPRGSNASESSKDDSPSQQELSKSDLTASSSSYASTKANGSADTPKEVRVLNNSHARRQIIRPWEDNSASSKQVPSIIDNLHTNSQKKPLQNGSSVSTTPAYSSLSTLTSPRIKPEQQDDCDGSSNDNAANSVQTAAEALVEIGQLPPPTSSHEATVESMELETKKSTLSVNSMLDVGSSSASLSGTTSASLDDIPTGPKEVAIDRKRQLALFHHVTQATESSSVEQMDRLHSTFEHIVFRHRMTLDKQRLIEVN